jgi:hypothetical protein
LDSVAVCHIYKNFPSYYLKPWICSAIMHWNRLKKGKRGFYFICKKEKGEGKRGTSTYFPTFIRSPLMDRDTKKFDIPTI